jgi:hypothetical protein
MNNKYIYTAVAAVAAIAAFVAYKKMKPNAEKTQQKVTKKIQDEFNPDTLSAAANIYGETGSLLKRYPPPSVNPSMSEETAVYNGLPAPQISQTELDKQSATNPDGSLRADTDQINAADVDLTAIY